MYATAPTASIGENSGALEIVVRSTQSNLERRYSAGDVRDGVGGAQLSSSGRWMAFRSASTQHDTPRTSVVAVELATGKRNEFSDVQQFAFLSAGGSSDVLVLHRYPIDEQTPVAQLELIRLPDGVTLARDTATAFAVNPQRTRLAWTGPQGLGLWQADTQRIRTFGGSTDCVDEHLTWSDKGAALAALRICKDAPIKIATLTRLAGRFPVVKVQLPKGMPADFAISPHAFMTRDLEQRSVLAWRDDERGLFFGVRRIGRKADTVEAQQSSAVVLWHARDQLPAQKSAWAKFDQFASFLSFMSLDDGRYVRLEDERLHVTDLPRRGQVALGYDADAYQGPTDPNYSRHTYFMHYRDYCLIDLQTGERRRVLEKLSVLLQREVSARPQLSPDGTVLLFQDDGDYIAWDVASGKRRNLTSGLPTRFYFEENVRNRQLLREPEEDISSPLQGWSADGRYVLISDYYDVWALPLHDGAARNLTGDGRRERRVYRRTLPEARIGREPSLREVPVDLAQPIFFHVVDAKTGDTGLARRQAAADATEVLDWQHARVQYNKARNSDRYLMWRESSIEPQNFYAVDANFRAAAKLTDVDSLQRELHWPPAARLLKYEVGGVALRGILHLPVDYEPGRSYPTIVSIYQRQARMLHNFLPPGDSVLQWQMRGYAVLLPDIQPRVNQAGRAALEAVLAAVDAAVATGVVDRDRLGLVGHSHGGFETSYIVTRTSLFKAAVPQSGWSDLLSRYGGVYERYGLPSSYVIERAQPYIAGPWWQHWDAFIENSPVFNARGISTPLLIAHGDADRLVPFSQSVELFNTLRRMGNEQVVLLQYVGLDHAFVGRAAADLQLRMEEFFDHFLKGHEAPRWWTEGVSERERIQ